MDTRFQLQIQPKQKNFYGGESTTKPNPFRPFRRNRVSPRNPTQPNLYFACGEEIIVDVGFQLKQIIFMEGRAPRNPTQLDLIVDTVFHLQTQPDPTFLSRAKRKSSPIPGSNSKPKPTQPSFMERKLPPNPTRPNC